MKHALVLYHFDACPFCIKVRQYLAQRGIKIAMRNIHTDTGAYEALLSTGGYAQVPCLLIDGKPLYESDDIIQWFEDHWKE